MFFILNNIANLSYTEYKSDYVKLCWPEYGPDQNKWKITLIGIIWAESIFKYNKIIETFFSTNNYTARQHDYGYSLDSQRTWISYKKLMIRGYT